MSSKSHVSRLNLRRDKRVGFFVLQRTFMKSAAAVCAASVIVLKISSQEKAAYDCNLQSGCTITAVAVSQRRE